jgi:hypothetical protein
MAAIYMSATPSPYLTRFRWSNLYYHIFLGVALLSVPGRDGVPLVPEMDLPNQAAASPFLKRTKPPPRL